MRLQRFSAFLAALAVAACAAVPPTPPAPAPVPPTPPVAAPEAPPPAPPPKPAEVQPPAAPLQPLQPAAWEDVEGWQEDDVAAAWEAFLNGCKALAGKPAWSAVCAEAKSLPADGSQARTFFQERFQPWRLINPDGTQQGLITGYYEPLLKGSRLPSARYRYPVYGQPDDLLIIDLGTLYPELKNLRLRGRLEGNRVVPYYSRADIDSGTAPLKGKELYWVEDEIELFFLQIQGSGRIKLDSGETVRVGYADQNGHPYKSLGKALIDRGELTLDKASMQGIKDWARKNPDKVRDFLNTNASYVFFRELPNLPGGPPGALGVPLVGGRSIAVDPKNVPLGAPVFLSTTWPGNGKALKRLMMAQDTGGAIRGAVRADFFWGFGPDAGKLAGSMKQQGRMWVLLPRDYPVPTQP